MYIYITTHKNTYEVGYHLTAYLPTGQPYNQWNTESEHHTIKEAAARVNYLNGGTGEPPKRPTTYADQWRNPYKTHTG
jgi:hypothetical protein